LNIGYADGIVIVDIKIFFTARGTHFPLIETRVMSPSAGYGSSAQFHNGSSKNIIRLGFPTINKTHDSTTIVR